MKTILSKIILQNIVSDESWSFKNNSNWGISISVNNASKHEKSKSKYDLNINLWNNDKSEESSSSKSEEAKKYSKETQDLKDKSTNLPSTVEATPAKHTSKKDSHVKGESNEK